MGLLSDFVADCCSVRAQEMAADLAGFLQAKDWDFVNARARVAAAVAPAAGKGSSAKGGAGAGAAGAGFAFTVQVSGQPVQLQQGMHWFFSVQEAVAAGAKL